MGDYPPSQAEIRAALVKRNEVTSVYVIVCGDDYLYEAYLSAVDAEDRVAALNGAERPLVCAPHSVESVPVVGGDAA